MTTGDAMTVGEVAAVVGVTVRTLHHWESRGVVGPSLRTGAGYRLYGAQDLARIQRACLYRELGVPLGEIARLLDDPGTTPAESLRRQRSQLVEQLERLQAMVTGLDRMIDAHDHGLLLTPDQQAAVFGPQWQPEWIEQARQRWGDTRQWAEYAERSAGRTAVDWSHIAARSGALDEELAAACLRGVRPGSAEGNDLAERHRAGMGEYFDCSHQMQVCLGRLYQEDPGFSAHYDGKAPGMTAWLRAVIEANAVSHGVDPDTATWR